GALRRLSLPRPPPAGARMTATIAKRLAHMIVVLFLVSFGTFFLVDLVPGDVAVNVLGPNASGSDYRQVRHQLGLDKPFVERYADWLGKVVHGDLGKTLVPPVESVETRLSRALPVNPALMVRALIIAF